MSIISPLKPAQLAVDAQESQYDIGALAEVTASYEAGNCSHLSLMRRESVTMLLSVQVHV
jgi:hypothetical protein